MFGDDPVSCELEFYSEAKFGSVMSFLILAGDSLAIKLSTGAISRW